MNLTATNFGYLFRVFVYESVETTQDGQRAGATNSRISLMNLTATHLATFSMCQAKLRKMVDEQVSVGTRVEDMEPEPADPLITPASSALERDFDPRPVPPERRLLIGTLDKRNGSLNGDKEGTLNRTTRLTIRNGKDNPFIG